MSRNRYTIFAEMIERRRVLLDDEHVALYDDISSISEHDLKQTRVHYDVPGEVDVEKAQINMLLGLNCCLQDTCHDLSTCLMELAHSPSPEKMEELETYARKAATNGTLLSSSDSNNRMLKDVTDEIHRIARLACNYKPERKSHAAALSTLHELLESAR